MLLKWEAAILNRLYSTNIFDKIVLKSSQVDDINYELPLKIYLSITQEANEERLIFEKLKMNDFINGAHLLCKSKNMEEKRGQILAFNQTVRQMQTITKEQQFSKSLFTILHVILFSSLSKCTIWPNMFKTSRSLVPSLIQFYNRFFNEFTQYLEYKFDPLILSSKFNRLVKQIKEKKLAHPELFAAVQTDDCQKIKEIFAREEQPIINQCMKNGLFISHFAAMKAKLDTIRLLLSLGADFELLDEQQQTPLFYAVKRFDLSLIKFLVQQVKVNINHVEYQNRTPIYLAAFQGNLQIVQYLYSMGGDPNIESKLARTPLSKACYLGNVKVAEYLLKIGVKIDSIDSKGRTALHNAAWGIQGGRQGKRRGNIKLQDSPECVQLLIKAGHVVDFDDFDKFTPLFSAISSHAQRSMRILLANGANLNHRTKKEQSSVFIAAKYGHLKIMSILIEQFACDYLAQSIQGYSPFAATLTLEDQQCSHYLLNLYVTQMIKIDMRAILRCLTEFDKWTNLQYIINWFSINQQDEKYKLIAGSIENHLEKLLTTVFSIQDEEKINNFLKMMQRIQKYFTSHEIMNTVFRFTEDHQIFNDTVIQMMLYEQKVGYTLPKIPLTDSLTEQTLIKLLQIDSNLSSSLSNLYSSLISIINLRQTKVIIYVLSLSSNKQQKGICRFNKYDLINIIFNKFQGKISLVDYCLVNGYYDIHKILTSFYNENYEVAELQLKQERPQIPKYRYRSEVAVLQNSKSYLMPILNAKELLSPDYIKTNLLTAGERAIYDEIKANIKQLKMNPIIVNSIQTLKRLHQYIGDHQLIGIDIEHYSSSNQSFICLIQISTLQQVFIIDKFSPITLEVSQFLKELFKDDKKIKIFHSYDNDLKWLVEDYGIVQFHTVLDTSRLSNLMAGMKNHTPSLKHLANHCLGLQMRKQFQKSDWRIRPLFSEMIDYAACDAKILPFLLLKIIEIIHLTAKNTQIIETIKYLESKRPIKSSLKRNIIEFD